MLLPGIGEEGQHRLRRAHALVVGVGALGSVIVDSLARAGIGRLTIVDRDLVELTNLQRQILFDESDVADARPKAIAAQEKIARINTDVEVVAHVDDFNHRNAERYAHGSDIILDGLDNFETRYLLNDLAVKHAVPYVYGGAVGMTGVAMTVLPHPGPPAGTHLIEWAPEASTPCLRCVFPEAPPPGATPTCDTAGVLGPVVMMIAAHQAAEAMKLIAGRVDTADRSLLSIDVSANETRRFDLKSARTAACPCCGERDFQTLTHGARSAATSLCGRDAVQVLPPPGEHVLDLASTAGRLAAHGEFSHNRFMLRGAFTEERTSDGVPVELTLFPNGRAIIKGVDEPERARSIYARYVGH